MEIAIWCVEMLIKLNNLRFSSLILILTTLFLWGRGLPSKAETIDAQLNNKQRENIKRASLLTNIKLTETAQNPTPDPSRENIQPNVTEQEDNSSPKKTPAQSPTEDRVLVSEVQVEGVESKLKDLVYSTIKTKPGRTTTRSQLQEDLDAVYATGLFQDVEVTPQDTPLGVRITFAIQANPVLNQVKIQSVGQENSVVPAKKVGQIFSKNYGQILNLKELQQGIIQVNEWYGKQGYELAQVVGAPEISPEGEVTLVVAEGIIENIEVRYFDAEDEPVKGKTRQFIITREVELEPGSIFKRDTAQQDFQRLSGLGLFEDVRFSFSPGEDPNKVVVNIDVVEGGNSSFSPMFGYGSDNGLFGAVSLQQTNLGGNNQTLETELKFDQDSLLFDINFTDPWIASSDSRTSYSVNAFRRQSRSTVFDGDRDIDTDNGNDSPRIVRTGGGINLAKPISSDPFERQKWRLSSSIQYQRVAVKNADGDIAPLSAEPTPNNGKDERQNLAFSDDGTDDLFALSLGVTRDRLNNPLQPTQGSLLKLETEQTLPIGSGNILFNRLRGNYSQYLPVNLFGLDKPSETFAFNFQAGTIFGDLPPYEAFALGGANSIRGFEVGEIGNGRSTFQATAEYRFPIFKIVGGALFFDYGTTLGTDNNVPGRPSVVRNLPGSGYGYGLGVRLNTPILPIRIDYAINDDGEDQIQFGIKEKF
jgi:outer membrane protein insertion porin family